MNLLGLKKTQKKDIRDVVYDERAIKRAAKESIKDQKRVAAKAHKLRLQHAR